MEQTTKKTQTQEIGQNRHRNAREYTKTRNKNHLLQNTQRESLQYDHAKSVTKRTSLLEHTLNQHNDKHSKTHTTAV